MNFTISVRIGIDKGINGVETFIDEEIALRNELQIKYYVEEHYRLVLGLVQSDKGDKIPPCAFDLGILRNQKKCDLWNAVFYFIEYDLPYDFMFPYVDGDLQIALEETNKHI